jgi:hypothetical protein
MANKTSMMWEKIPPVENGKFEKARYFKKKKNGDEKDGR